MHYRPPHYKFWGETSPPVFPVVYAPGHCLSYPRTFYATFQLHSLIPSFEASSFTLKLPQAKSSVFNIYCPPSSSAYSVSDRTFLRDLNEIFLSFAATTPHEFIITGDFNIYLDNPTDHLTSQILYLLSSFNLTQHVNFPTHNMNHTLDLVISSSDTSLAPSSLCSLSDHFPVFTELLVNRTPLPPPTSHSFRRLHSIDTDSFLSDFTFSQLITNPPDSLDCLLTAYCTS